MLDERGQDVQKEQRRRMEWSPCARAKHERIAVVEQAPRKGISYLTWKTSTLDASTLPKYAGNMIQGRALALASLKWTARRRRSIETRSTATFRLTWSFFSPGPGARRSLFWKSGFPSPSSFRPIADDDDAPAAAESFCWPPCSARSRRLVAFPCGPVETIPSYSD